ncbi:MAG: amino acid ABC transporter permease [Acidimicrobiia bacterium]|nr:MAG: amino acid ABC transporter permease [Acidimicrobiia bacterium]
MTTLDTAVGTDPTPPGSKIRYEWSGFPWWFLGIVAVIAYPVFKILTDDTWSDGFLFIKDGLRLTLVVTLGGFVIAMIVGLVVSLGRMSKNTILRNLAMFYIELIRGVPVLVTIFFVGLVIWPEFVSLIGIKPQSFLASNTVKTTVAVGLIYAAFIAEVFRAGIESVNIGQREAGMSMGLSKRHVFRLIVWPQAIKNVMPALGNDLIALLKDSSLVSILAVREITQMMKLWTGGNFQFFAGLMVLAAMYLVLTVSLSVLLQWYERRIATP